MAIQGGPKINRDGLVLWVDAASPRSFRGEPVVNLINTSSLSITRYNNPGFSGSLVTTNQTFKGAPVYEGTFFASASSFIPRLGSTEGFGLFYQTPGYSASTYYVASVYFKTDYPLPTSSTQGFIHTYANVGPFGGGGTANTRYTEGEWTRLYTRFYANTNGYATRTITYPGQYGSGMTYVVNTTSTQNVDVVLTVSASTPQVPDFSTLYAIVGAAPSILANGGLTGLSIVDHGLDTTTFTKLSYPSNIKLKAELPFDYYIRLSVPSTGGVNTTIRLASNFSTYLNVVTDGKYWKVTFDTGSLTKLPLDYPIKTYWAAPMMEIKTGSTTYPSEFTFGTRGSSPSQGGGWIDLSGFNNSATVVSASYNNINGGTLVSDGTNPFANIVPSDTLVNSSSFSVEAWVKRANTGSIHGILSDLQFGWWTFYIDSNDKLTMNLIATSGSGFLYNGGVSSRTIGTNWTHVACVLNMQSGLKLYIDGQVAYSNSNGTPMYLVSSNRGPQFIGEARLGAATTSNVFSGSIASIRLYKTALSDIEILQNFNSQRSRFGI